MPGNTFGKLFQVTSFGESHGGFVGCVIDGCPPGLSLAEEDIQPDLDRRKPGQGKTTSARKEPDKIKIQAGVFEGKTLGTPILLTARNLDARPRDYQNLKSLYRPSHADYTYQAKYGLRDWRGGGRASARETLARVAAGAVARKYLKEKLSVKILAYVEQIGDLKTKLQASAVKPQEIAANSVRCPDQKLAPLMLKLIENVKAHHDSIGGIIRGVIKNSPVGLGEPVFDKLSADLGKAMLSINAAKGFDLGSGFAASEMLGSEHNDEFYVDRVKKVRTKTNYSGGIQGGISNGEDIYFRVAFKPVSTIGRKQKTVSAKKQKVILEAKGRHDPCVVPRAVPIVEAMAALVIMDHYLRHKAQNLPTQ